MTHRLVCADSLEYLKTRPDNKIHAVVTDPPYGIHFMQKSWDQFGTALGVAHTKTSERSGSMHAGRYDLSPAAMLEFQEWTRQWAEQALRVLKPGGHLISFASPRTYHRMACGIEEAGFEIRDQIAWMFGSGFPKSHNVGVSIDKMLGHTRERVESSGGIPSGQNQYIATEEQRERATSKNSSEAVSAEAGEWNGWGTALKPAMEPIVIARKPLSVPGVRPGTMRKATVAKNVLEHGVGALNIDACRIATDENLGGGAYADSGNRSVSGSLNPSGMNRPGATAHGEFVQPAGRWPANVALDEEAAAILDAQAPRAGAASPVRGTEPSDAVEGDGVYGDRGRVEGAFHGDGLAGASRFFYVAKAGRKERDAGLEDFEAKFAPTMGDGIGGVERNPDTASAKRNTHPTVKPIALMEWLCNLVCPPGGVILDPFMGSGSTGIAALSQGFNFVGIDREDEYVRIAQARIAHWAPTSNGTVVGLVAEGQVVA